MDIPENLWTALNLARNIRLQNQKDAATKESSGGGETVRGYNVDAEP